MTKLAFALLCLGICFEVSGQDQPSIREILLRAKASYELTQNLSTDVEVAANMELAANVDFKFKMKLAWMRDGSRYRMDTAGSLDDNGVHIDALIPATICRFDGREHWTYTDSPIPTGTRPEMQIHSGPDAARRVNKQFLAGLCLDGVLYGDMEDVFTILLRQINAGTINVTPVTLDGRECVQIVAAVPEGNYALWLDPSVQYRLRKSIVVKSGEQPFFGKPIGQSSEWTFVEAAVTDIDIKNVLGGTLPTSGQLNVHGTAAENSVHTGSPARDLYVFSRSNCRLGGTLSDGDLALKLPEGVQIFRKDE